MLFLLGNSRMESGDFNDAIQLFQRAQDQARYQTRYYTSQALSPVSLVSDLMAILRRTETFRDL